MCWLCAFRSQQAEAGEVEETPFRLDAAVTARPTRRDAAEATDDESTMPQLGLDPSTEQPQG